MKGTLKRVAPAASERQVRAVVVCRPLSVSDGRRAGPGAAADALEQLDVADPCAAGLVPPVARDAGLLRDISVGREAQALRLPLYGASGAPAEQLCEREVAPLLRHLLAGESAAVIAYGQTGSGKSYTMGTERYEEGQGPAPHSVGSFCARGVFGLAQESGVKELEVSFAAIEIYREGRDKERLFDLQTLERKRLESFEQQAKWERAASADELQSRLLCAAHTRNTDRTDGNARSSRSHAIFVTQVQLKRQEPGGGWQRVKARLMLVDLAGSERAALAAAGSASQKQGSGINVGLLFLGMVINELAERGETKNYAFSVLTKILKPALGGGSNEVTSSCNALILGCISPLAVHLGNTRATLEFLQSAGTVKNVVRADVQALRQQELAAEVEDLRRQLRGMQLQLSAQRWRQGGAAGAGSSAAPDLLPGAAAAGGPGSMPHPPASMVDGFAGQPAAADAAAADLAAADMGAAAVAAAEEARAAAEEELAAARAELATARKELVVQRDRADAFEAVLRQQEAAAAAATTAAAQTAGDAAEGSVAPDGASPALAATPAGAAAATPASGPAAAGSPAAALLAASPLLAASREVAEWVADAAATTAATPPGQRLPLLAVLPGAEAVVAERESHMAPAELAALKDKVERLLSAAAGGDDRAQALAFAEASLYAVLAYNACLGAALTSAEDAAEDLQAARHQHSLEFAQLYQEKAAYMRRTAAAEGGLAEYETQVEELQAQLTTAQKALQQACEAAADTPGRWGSLGRLLSGRSPAAGPGATPGAGSGGSRRSSQSGSPAASPRHAGAPQQQLFAATPSPSPSPSRLSQPHAAPARDGGARRVTIACVARLDEPAAAAAAAAALADGERRKAKLTAVAAEADAQQDGALIKAVCVRTPADGQAGGQAPAPGEEQPPRAAKLALWQEPRQGETATDAAVHADAAPAEAQPSEQLAPAVKPEPTLLPVGAATPPAAGQQQQQQQQQPPPLLPGPCIAVLVPAPAAGGRGRRARGAAAVASRQPQEFDYSPATGAFRLPGTDQAADPLAQLTQALPPGEPWQRHVHLKAPGGRSGITLERWLTRAMLLPGRCHFCCRAAPDPRCRHPEAAFGELHLCAGCHSALEPEAWRTSEDWQPGGPDDPGHPWCCLCGAAGCGATDQLLMCSACELCGFCSGCLWRFGGDDLAAALAPDARFTCLLCRPAPRLALRYAADEPAAGGGSDAELGGGDASPRRTCGRARPRQQTPAEFDCVVDLAGSSSEEEAASSSSSEGEEEAAVCSSSSSSSSGDDAETPPPPRRGGRGRGRGGAAAGRGSANQVGGRGRGRGRKAAAAAGDWLAEAAAAAVRQLSAAAGPARKRNRLLAKGDLVSSPADGERPALQRQRMQRPAAASTAAAGAAAGEAPSLSQLMRSTMHL